MQGLGDYSAESQSASTCDKQYCPLLVPDTAMASSAFHIPILIQKLLFSKYNEFSCAYNYSIDYFNKQDLQQTAHQIIPTKCHRNTMQYLHNKSRLWEAE